jgi:hypothetical protein
MTEMKKELVTKCENGTRLPDLAVQYDNTKMGRIEAAITTSANKITGNSTNKRLNEWFDEYCNEVIKKLG